MQSQDKPSVQSQGTQPSNGSDDVQVKKTIDWAKESGYQPTAGALRRREGKLAGLPRRRQSPATAPPAAPTRPASVVPPKALTPDWSTGVSLKKTLKGDHDKNVALVEVDGRNLVLKGAEGTPVAHAAAAKFIGALALRGVRAPQTRVLDAREKAAVMQALNGQAQNDKRADDMIRALNLGEGQLSEVATGRSLDKIIPPKAVKAMLEKSISLREDNAADLDDSAWADAFQVVEQEAPLVKRKPNYLNWRDAADPGSRQQALKEMRREFVAPHMQPLFDVLAEIAGGTRTQGLIDAKAEAAAVASDRTQLEAFAKSDDGITAFAGVAAADLVSGMFDRITEDWNGGNFLFDSGSQELVCVDNAKGKLSDTGLTTLDAEAWRRDFFDKVMKEDTLADVLYEKIYGKNPGAPDAPGNYVTYQDDDARKKAEEHAKGIIRDVLADIVQKIEGDKDIDAVAKQRAAVIKTRMELDDLLGSLLQQTPNLPRPPPLPAKLDAKDKVGRTLGSVFSKKKDKRGDTQRIKDALRDGRINGQEALDMLKKLESSSETLGGDRRSEKIKFLATAVDFCSLIGDMADQLAPFVQAGILADAMGAKLGAQLRPTFDEWLQASANDKAILGRLNTAWSGFPDSVREKPAG